MGGTWGKFSSDHYCWDDHGPYWKWRLDDAGVIALIMDIRSLVKRYKNTPLLEILEFSGPRTMWESQRGLVVTEGWKR